MSWLTMLNEKRIKEAEINFKSYLNEGLIRKEKFKKEVFNTYMKNYQESIKLLNFIDKNKISCLWEIVVAYYSMFYIANAFLYKIGYKTGSRIVHKVTADALIVLARKKLNESFLEDFDDIQQEALEFASTKADEIVSSFDKERVKRNIFQYGTHEEIKESKAKTSFSRATQFCNEIMKLLSD